MIVLVDTPIWSLALRRSPTNLNSGEQKLTTALAELIREGRAQIVGVIRQELLSGIRDQERFVKVRENLCHFHEPELEIADYEQAAEMHNHCRARGIAGSAIDFLICSIAHRRNWQIFTSDRDFEHYARVLALNLYSA
jgi:predicted nucleic acid-binding protein